MGFQQIDMSTVARSYQVNRHAASLGYLNEWLTTTLLPANPGS
jgi:hypothetical protein